MCAMKRAPLGSSGIEVSRLCMGSMQMGWTATEPESFAVLDAFVAAGGNFIDTADIYSNWIRGNHGGDAETIIGNWMQARGNRHDVVIATKARGRMWPGPDGEGLGRKHLRYSVNGSLKRLQTDRIDLFQCHWFDENTPIAETLDTFAEIIAEGKIGAIGLSNYPPDRFAEAIAASGRDGRPGIASLQPHHSLVHRKEFEDGLQALCLEHNIAVIPYSPLASGFLTGKYIKGGPKVASGRTNATKRYFTDDGWAVLDAVREVAAAHGSPPAAVALAWQLAQPAITAPIVGANSPAQLADQLPALDLELTAAELRALDEASQPFLIDGDSHPGR
jgi:aryl-alcohol dehydrogenase-like predicted oxidoreductase